MGFTIDANGDVINSATGEVIGNQSDGYSVDDSGNLLQNGQQIASASDASSNPLQSISNYQNSLTNPTNNSGFNLSSLLGAGNTLGNALGGQSLANIGGAAYLGNALTNAGQNIAGAATQQGQNIGNTANQQIQNLGNVGYQQGQNIGNTTQNLSQNLTNVGLQQGQNISNVANQQIQNLGNVVFNRVKILVM